MGQDGGVSPIHAESRFRLYLTHAFLNTVHAGFQGKLVSLNMTARLTGTDPEEGNVLKAVLGELARWGQQLWRGQPMLAREGATDPSSDAPLLLELVDELRHDLLELVPLLEDALARPDLLAHRNSLVVIATSLGRRAYAEEHDVRGWVLWGRVYGSEELATRYLHRLATCQERVRAAHGFLETLDTGREHDAAFVDELRSAALPLPGIFRSQVHDLAVLIGRRRGQLSYELAGIADQEADRWRRLGIDAESAGHWHAHGFLADEAKAWRNAGLADPATAAAWRLRDFELDEAVHWRSEGFTAVRAHRERAKNGHQPSAISRQQQDD